MPMSAFIRSEQFLFVLVIANICISQTVPSPWFPFSFLGLYILVKFTIIYIEMEEKQ